MARSRGLAARVYYDATADTTLNASTAVGLDAEAFQGSLALHERLVERMVSLNRSFVGCVLPAGHGRESNCHRVRCHFLLRAGLGKHEDALQRLRRRRLVSADALQSSCANNSGLNFVTASGDENCNATLTSVLEITEAVTQAPTPAPSSGSSSSGLGTWGIVGIVVAILFVLGLVAACKTGNLSFDWLLGRTGSSAGFRFDVDDERLRNPTTLSF